MSIEVTPKESSRTKRYSQLLEDYKFIEIEKEK